jgi:hypothetical protein
MTRVMVGINGMSHVLMVIYDARSITFDLGIALTTSWRKDCDPVPACLISVSAVAGNCTEPGHPRPLTTTHTSPTPAHQISGRVRLGMSWYDMGHQALPGRPSAGYALHHPTSNEPS